jgi:hypothetical protein
MRQNERLAKTWHALSIVMVVVPLVIVFGVMFYQGTTMLLAIREQQRYLSIIQELKEYTPFKKRA